MSASDDGVDQQIARIAAGAPALTSAQETTIAGLMKPRAQTTRIDSRQIERGKQNAGRAA